MLVTMTVVSCTCTHAAFIVVTLLITIISDITSLAPVEAVAVTTTATSAGVLPSGIVQEHRTIGHGRRRRRFFFRQSARKRLSAFISSLHIVNNKAHQVRLVGAAAAAAEATAALEGNERPMEHRLKVFLLLLLVVLVLIKKYAGSLLWSPKIYDYEV